MRRVLSDSLVKDIAKAYDDGESSPNVAKRFGVSINSVFAKSVTNAKCTIRPMSRIYQCNVGGNHQVASLLTALYGNATVSLDRKYAIYLACVAASTEPRRPKGYYAAASSSPSNTSEPSSMNR